MSNATQNDSIIQISQQLSSQTLSFAPLVWLKLLHVMYLQKQTEALVLPQIPARFIAHKQCVHARKPKTIA